jgi:hypothetical protein
MPSVHPRQPARDRESPTQVCRFVREGEYWTIAFDGTVSRFRHSRGLQHLARLLRAPGTPISASALAGEGRDPDRRQLRPSAPSNTERARSAVTKTIKAAIRRLGTYDAALAFHLGATVKTGYVCAYTPDPGRRIRWVVEDRTTGT